LTLAPTAGMIFGPDVNSDGTLDMYVSNGEVDEVLIYSGSSFLETFVTSGLGGLDDAICSWSTTAITASAVSARLLKRSLP